ncbi:MAG: hypothetical protein EZS28_019413 [Streblomastix strix]|uniref:Uncharacterized protein n=1 Tax=Streblomastix strix TaxID=222440 RepID=A0A5J4VRN8_9EUKA|nr:MAG: hypothetical protein EZS28_019413 [Streblomastix strix]
MLLLALFTVAFFTNVFAQTCNTYQVDQGSSNTSPTCSFSDDTPCQKLQLAFRQFPTITSCVIVDILRGPLVESGFVIENNTITNSANSSLFSVTRGKLSIINAQIIQQAWSDVDGEGYWRLSTIIVRGISSSLVLEHVTFIETNLDYKLLLTFIEVIDAPRTDSVRTINLTDTTIKQADFENKYVINSAASSFNDMFKLSVENITITQGGGLIAVTNYIDLTLNDFIADSISIDVYSFRNNFQKFQLHRCHCFHAISGNVTIENSDFHNVILGNESDSEFKEVMIRFLNGQDGEEFDDIIVDMREINTAYNEVDVEQLLQQNPSNPWIIDYEASEFSLLSESDQNPANLPFNLYNSQNIFDIADINDVNTIKDIDNYTAYHFSKYMFPDFASFLLLSYYNRSVKPSHFYSYACSPKQYTILNQSGEYTYPDISDSALKGDYYTEFLAYSFFHRGITPDQCVANKKYNNEFEVPLCPQHCDGHKKLCNSNNNAKVGVLNATVDSMKKLLTKFGPILILDESDPKIIFGWKQNGWQYSHRNTNKDLEFKTLDFSQTSNLEPALVFAEQLRQQNQQLDACTYKEQIQDISFDQTYFTEDYDEVGNKYIEFYEGTYGGFSQSEHFFQQLDNQFPGYNNLRSTFSSLPSTITQPSDLGFYQYSLNSSEQSNDAIKKFYQSGMYYLAGFTALVMYNQNIAPSYYQNFACYPKKKQYITKDEEIREFQFNNYGMNTGDFDDTFFMDGIVSEVCIPNSYTGTADSFNQCKDRCQSVDSGVCYIPQQGLRVGHAQHVKGAEAMKDILLAYGTALVEVNSNIYYIYGWDTFVPNQITNWKVAENVSNTLIFSSLNFGNIVDADIIFDRVTCFIATRDTSFQCPQYTIGDDKINEIKIEINALNNNIEYNIKGSNTIYDEVNIDLISPLCSQTETSPSFTLIPEDIEPQELPFYDYNCQNILGDNNDDTQLSYYQYGLPDFSSFFHYIYYREDFQPSHYYSLTCAPKNYTIETDQDKKTFPQNIYNTFFQEFILSSFFSKGVVKDTCIQKQYSPSDACPTQCSDNSPLISYDIPKKVGIIHSINIPFMKKLLTRLGPVLILSNNNPVIIYGWNENEEWLAMHRTDIESDNTLEFIEIKFVKTDKLVPAVVFTQQLEDNKELQDLKERQSLFFSIIILKVETQKFKFN